ncbi:MAG: DUF2090 domain-containing protein [Patescibacteria group bacterium]|jgi:5-dehydro-2-deoxygluconokinase
MLGYNKPLYILPFDHRQSFAEKMFGWEDLFTIERVAKLAEYKQIIYEGFALAVSRGVPKESAAILVDEQCGDLILRQARQAGFIVCMCTEKSGQAEFDFEFNHQFGEHLDKYRPQFAKALLRYNPGGDEELNERQRQRLAKLSDYCRTHGYKFMLEVLVPPTVDQLNKVQADHRRYNLEMRPDLAIKMVKELQKGGVDPDVWKIEGFQEMENYQDVIKQMRKGRRGQVCMIVLGRGETRELVEKWIETGARVDGVIGFAVGRTVFWQALVDFKSEKITREQAVEQIANNFKYFADLFIRFKFSS